VIRQLHKYLHKLEGDGSVRQGRIALVAQDDLVCEAGAADLCTVGRTLLSEVKAVALVIGEPWLSFQNLYPQRLLQEAQSIIPLDTETRTFLHDIPLVRRRHGQIDWAEVAGQLGQRKGVLVEGVGIIAVGSVTVEQGYINFSTLYHALFVGYLLELLQDAPRYDEMDDLRPLLEQIGNAIPELLDDIAVGPFTDEHAARKALEQAGQRTIELHLVDSFFGNISCHVNNQMVISQTGASLDALAGCVDLVPDDNSSTAGLTASSELPAHRAIYKAIGAAVILHGHPKFTVIMSLLCQERGCHVTDCWKDCPKVRHLGNIPVVAGEVGAGGVAKTLAPVMADGIGVVYGHGVFAAGMIDFRQPLQKMIALENWCRTEYLRLLKSKMAW
jgi:ribulose-5-phosphate 4-epimerase/fuculose-1-phosphate aldolase